MNRTSHSEKPGLRTVQRALRMMEWVAARGSNPTVREVTRTLGFNPATGYHLVNTLTASGYLVKGDDRRLQLGPKVASLHQAFLQRQQSARSILPLLEDLSTRTGETAYLSTWIRGEVVLQAIVEGSATLRVTGLYVGLRGAAYCRASGKAILAYLPPAERAAYLAGAPFPARTPKSLTGRRALEQSVAQVRVRGYAIDDQEFEPGVCCVGAPYFDSDSVVRGAITVAMPSSRFAASRTVVCRLTKEAAAKASVLLGYRSTDSTARAVTARIRRAATATHHE